MKSTYCDLSSFGPPLFEIWWPDIYLGGPYGPVKNKMYWSGGLKSAPGQRASAYVEGCVNYIKFTVPVIRVKLLKTVSFAAKTKQYTS